MIKAHASRWMLLVGSVGFFAFGCAHEQHQPQASRPSLAPVTQPTASLQIDASHVQPMYRELLAVDLPTVIRVATAQNLEIERARQRVEASRGQYEASVESIFPIIAPTLAGQWFNGVNQNANGTLTVANFANFLPAISVYWIINPGQVAYDIVASKRRLEASGQDQRSVILETIRRAAVQYYDLVLAQRRVAVAQQAVGEADELLRIERVKLNAGTGLPADELRAQAALAGAQQDLLIALNKFYDASVELALTLHLDSTVTLVPRSGPMKQTTLVREEMSINEMLAAAVQYRPDLESVRTLLRASAAQKDAVVWGGLGPQVAAAYSFGGIQTHNMGETSGMHEQQKASGAAGFALGLSTFGKVKTAKANERLAAANAQLQLDHVRAGVVSSQQASATAAKLIPVAAKQVAAAEEALRLTQANLQAGTALTLDVLQAQDAADQARLRYADAVVRYNQSQVNLLAAMGLVDDTTLTALAQATDAASPNDRARRSMPPCE